MKRKKLVLFASVFGLAILVCATKQVIAGAGDAKLVKIVPEESAGFFVDPPTLNIKMNTIVVWMNGVPNKELKIVFEQGRTCKDVTANPNIKQPGFFLDSHECYVTSYLPYGATSTLQFPEGGEFEYKVVTEDGTLHANGEIIVR